MEFYQTLILALIQGITEFLPVSSSAHLVFPSHLLGWPDQGLSFDVAVHFGTLAAVMLYYREWVLKLCTGMIQQPKACLGLAPVKQTPEGGDARLVKHLIIASIPVFIGGAFMEFYLPGGIRSTDIIGWATLIFASLLYFADRYQGTKSEYDILAKTALLIGLIQVFALIPGASRSGVTIAAGLLLGMSATGAANFSFLLSIPTILAATVLKTLSLIGSDIDVDWSTLATGAIISGVFAYISIGWFIGFLNKVGMIPFVIYRIILGILLLTLL